MDFTNTTHRTALTDSVQEMLVLACASSPWRGMQDAHRFMGLLLCSRLRFRHRLTGRSNLVAGEPGQHRDTFSPGTAKDVVGLQGATEQRRVRHDAPRKLRRQPDRRGV